MAAVRVFGGAGFSAPECFGGPVRMPTMERLAANRPVVHVSWYDAVAYATWSGTRHATEAEWEQAARGGVDGAHFPWGTELEPHGEHRMNVFQGVFPDRDTGADG